MDLWAVFAVYAVLGTAQVNFRLPFVWEGVGVFLAFGGAGLLSSARSSRRARSDEPRTRARRQLPLQLAEQELQEHEPSRAGPTERARPAVRRDPTQPDDRGRA
jgi:cobalamin biosynthesis protein CobD/CbiB